MRATVLSLVLSIPSLAGADVQATSRIDAVTVYRSTARVTRVARVEVPAGDARVLLAGLPAELDDDSVRVEGRGVVKLHLHGVTVDEVTAASSGAAEAKVAERRLLELQEEDRALEDRIAAARARARFVESLKATYSEERAKNMAVRPVSAKEWADVASFVEAEGLGAGKAVRAAESARRELKRKIEAASAELGKLAAKGRRVTKSIAVEVASDGAGPAELVVSYTVPSAGWRPVWDARLDPATSKVELAFQGSVWQRTGEDWSGVRLAVSTAAPARSLFVPQLEPRWLDRVVPLRRDAAPAAPAAETFAAARAKSARAGAVAEKKQEVAGVEAEEPAAEIEQGLLAASFASPRRESVDGAGRARKVLLARFPLAAELTRTSAPRLDRAAFLTAKAVNTTGVPILPGGAAVYVGEQFVGRADVPFTPPAGEIRMAFGADDRVEIERRVVERKHDTSGLIGKKDVWRYRVRLSVKSRWNEPVKLTLLDLVPVARDGEIEVAVLDGTTRATREDPERPGVRAWDLDLRPREERVIELAYEVRVPRGVAVAGLD
jgi:uncharacterized protein (TIGR02231 family)